MTNDSDAGVRGYDVAVVENGVTRTALARNTLTATWVYTGLRTGSVYRWVVTATDNVNNIVTATATVAAAQATKTYYFGAMRVAVRSTGGGLVWLHSDHLSSVSAATDEQGRVVSRQLFAPYGEVRGEFGEMAGSWGWATHRTAEDTGLVFMRARWYSGYAGRFVSADTLVPDPTNSSAFNRYSYGYGNPISLNDPGGHDAGCAGRDAGECWQPVITFASDPDWKPIITYALNPNPADGVATATAPAAEPTATPLPSPTPEPTVAPVQMPTPESTAVSEPTASSTSGESPTPGFSSPVNGPYQVVCAFDAICWPGAQPHKGGDVVVASDPGANVRPYDDGVPGRQVLAANDGVIFGIYNPDTNSWTDGNPAGITIDVWHGDERWQYTHVYPTADILEQQRKAIEGNLLIVHKRMSHVAR